MSRRSRGVIVTGGSRGIGRAIANYFLREGDAVAVCARTPKEPRFRKPVFYSAVDVRSSRQQKKFFSDARKCFGSLDVVVNCAGVSRWRAVDDVDDAFLEETIGSNVLGTFWGCQAAANTLKHGGSIVNISSLAGKRGSANNSVYCASKFAVNGITQALAKELGPRGIRVNAVCPVYVETPMILDALKDPAAPPRGKSVQAYLKSFASTQTALGRLPTEEEVAALVYFLASPAASAITGQCINVDCGTLPQ